jgi:hypothetical protein
LSAHDRDLREADKDPELRPHRMPVRRLDDVRARELISRIADAA